jgi:hypothetical protein
MAEPDGSRISARLRRVPGQLLLALINATAILVIVAAILCARRDRAHQRFCRKHRCDDD